MRDIVVGSRIESEGAVRVPAVTVGRPPVESIVDLILGMAKSSPKVALMTTSTEVDRAAREVLAASQDPRNWERQSFREMVDRLPLPPNVREAVGQFYRVRNMIVHHEKGSDDDVLRAIDSGLTILRALRRLPRPVHVVKQPTVEIFADAQAAERRTDVHGVILETTNPDGSTRRAVFPTTRDHFEKGKPVAWEWSFERTWPASWYRDPETGEIEYAWTDSAEFVGRLLEEV